jgi:hypothetical protein
MMEDGRWIMGDGKKVLPKYTCLWQGRFQPEADQLLVEASG